MKLADRTVEIHSNGVDASNQFSIAQTSKMFKILSDSLYSDKVMAVIRELSTNANDAHVASGNRNPFKVSLPTQANPNFTVRDYGTGLSQEDMEELYTTYGASNKNDSNDFTGCLGLGSKSPFAYTKSFSTTSFFNGKAYNYIAAMDEGGVPSLSLFGVTHTDEPNGLEISFAVKQSDFQEFTNKSKRIFHYFKTKPMMEGGTCSLLQNHEYSHTNTIIEGTNWRVGRISDNDDKYPSTYNSPGAGIVAIMGNIAYPVDSDKIIGKEEQQQKSDAIQRWNRAFKKADVDNWTNLVKEILNSGMYLEITCDIGELEMDVSREGLQYTKGVIKTLREKTQDIYLQLKSNMSTKVEECTNLVDAYQTYYKLADIAGGYTAGAEWVDPEGKKHDLSAGEDLDYKLGKHKQLYVINYRTASHRSKRMLYLTDKIHHESLQGRSSNYWDNKSKSNPLAFFVCDTRSPETAKKIAIRYCNQNDCMAYLMVDTQNPAEDSGEGFAKLIKDIGGEENVKNISEYRSLLQSSTKGRTGTGAGMISKDEIFLLKSSKDYQTDECSDLSGNNLNDSNILSELSDSLVEGLEDAERVIYVPITRYKSVSPYPDLHKIYSLSSKDNVLGSVLFKRYNIYAIKQSSVAKLQKQGINLVCFNKWFKSKAAKMSKKLREEVGKYDAVINYCDKEYSTSDFKKTRSWSSQPERSDRVVMANLLNIYGLDYKDYIKNETVTKAMDQWLLMYYFAQVANSEYFNLRVFSRQQLEQHVNNIAGEYNIVEDAKDIHNKILKLNNMLFEFKKLYGYEELPSGKKSHSQAIIKTLPKMDSLRKILKGAIDKSPILKYIVSGNDELDIEKIKDSDPTNIHNNGYYGRDKWFDNIALIGLRETIGNLV